MNRVTVSARALALAGLIACGAGQAVAAGADMFFRDSRLTHVRISPDGARQVLVITDDTGFTLSLRGSAGGQPSLLLDSRKLLERDIKGVIDVGWIDNRHLALILIEDRTAIADLVETRSQRYTYFIDVQKPPRTKDEMVLIKTSGWFAHTLPRENGRFLYAKSGINSRVYGINVGGLHPVGRQLSKTDRIDGGQFSLENVVADIKGYAYRWFTTVDGAVVGALVRNEEGELVLMETADSGKNWTRLKVVVESSEKRAEKAKAANKKKGRSGKKNAPPEEAEKEEFLIPIAYAGKPGRYYAVLEKEETPDSLYLCDFTGESESRELLYQHPTADIFQVRTSHVDYKLLSVGISHRGGPEYIYFDEAHAGILDKVKRKGYQGYLAVSESDLRNVNHIIYNFASNNPGVVLLYNEPANELRKLGDLAPGLAALPESRLVVDELKTDDLAIEYFLSLPAGKARRHPLVVVPHGGPIGISDHRLYDPLTQYLVANGLAVLQVNYRGSAGYGNEFIEAGKKQWGSGMLDDIYNVLGVVKKRSDIDSGSICIAGGSYGGYAALALAIRHPAEFKCVASYAGVTDVQLMTSKPDATDTLIKWFNDYIGDPEKESDQLKKISPVYNASAIKVPLLLAHGTDDDRVDIEHLHRMSFALDRLNTPYEKIILDGVGHDFKNAQEAASFYSRLYAFLRKHIGK